MTERQRSIHLPATLSWSYHCTGKINLRYTSSPRTLSGTAAEWKWNLWQARQALHHRVSLLAVRSNFAVGDTITGKNRGPRVSAEKSSLCHRLKLTNVNRVKKYYWVLGLLSSRRGARDKYWHSQKSNFII